MAQRLDLARLMLVPALQGENELTIEGLVARVRADSQSFDQLVDGDELRKLVAAHVVPVEELPVTKWPLGTVVLLLQAPVRHHGSTFWQGFRRLSPDSFQEVRFSGRATVFPSYRLPVLSTATTPR
jgi:hypothetical protein